MLFSIVISTSFKKEKAQLLGGSSTSPIRDRPARLVNSLQSCVKCNVQTSLQDKGPTPYSPGLSHLTS